MSGSSLVRSEVREVGFGFYTDEDSMKLSVCKVTSPISQDSLGNSLPGGLYDLRMGPTDSSANCVTCGLSYFNCPGHAGHVELDVPVYRPLLFASMFQMLRSKCAYCHRLRLSRLKAQLILAKLKLLEMGDISAAESFDVLATSAATVLEDVVSKQDLAVDIEGKVKSVEARYSAYIKGKGLRAAGLEIKTKQRTTIDLFLRGCIAAKKCENCGGFSPNYRKDGYSKIFQRPLSKKTQKAMQALKLKLKTALEASQGDTKAEEYESDESVDEDDDEDEEATANDPSGADKYMVQSEVEAQIKLLWDNHTEFFSFVWSRAIHDGLPAVRPNKNGYKLFFQRIVLVPPNRFRPMAKVGEASAEHPQNHNLSKLILTNESIRRVMIETNASSKIISPLENVPVEEFKSEADIAQARQPQSGLSKIVTMWIDLQNAVNMFMDSAKNPNPLGGGDVPGIRQILERKEGLFRRHMMGKRVNYCCRSVISPDPYIGTNEVGIPVAFAKTLHYPVPVNDWNVKHLRKLVENGPNNYPGANQIELGDGKIIKLDKLSDFERAAKARLLQSSPGIKVYRHLVDGDMLLVNRQPTLHKPGIMAHKARVLKHVREQTIRLSYANCNSYNADFDGDEMNCHFVQNPLAMAEANTIANTDNQYIVPTSGNPLRGLIQDHVVSGVKLTCRDTFLTREEFQQLVYIAVTGLPGTEIVTYHEEIVLPCPAILKPKPRWTGKQVITALIKHLCRPPLPSLHLDGKTRTPATAFGEEHREHIVIFRFGELLCGVMDKAAVGNSSLGIVHAVYELYGAELAGRLLNAFGRLFTFYLQDAGQSCGIEDLTLNQTADAERKRLLVNVAVDAEIGLKAFLTEKDGVAQKKATTVTAEDKELCRDLVEAMIVADRKDAKAKLDGAMQQVINQSASAVIKVCIPNGLELPFQQNDFAMMVLTGAKGSAVNLSQICCFLGQQALEGMRVPIMVSGKSLPSFQAYDPSARAGGFVQDRFLTGVKPQEYYFHCMAGREGLVDTAVKTSRSGYLQRCLVKHLEELKVNYDMTVRDSGGNIIQFLYGEDGLDPVNTALLGGSGDQMQFLARNNQALVHKYSLHNDFFARSKIGGLELDTATEHHDNSKKAKALVEVVNKANPRNKSDVLVSELTKGSIVLARRKVSEEVDWERGNIKRNWFSAEVVKVRSSEKKKGKSVEAAALMSYDLKYLSDGVVVKKVPLIVYTKPRVHKSEITIPSIPMYLIKAGELDTAMNSLKLNTAVGAISESIQTAIDKFVKANPDAVITDNTTDTTVSAQAFELLVWVKYLRSLACPGEAVGCVAAQSVGEPSTQMTLNTFHLAGHGGANVTLGIPRLREILMTAARVPKTPTMLVPIRTQPDGTPDKYLTKARVLAKQLCRLTLGSLLNHKGGVEVQERLGRGPSGLWERCYRLKLNFESPQIIQKVFGASFAEIVRCVRTSFLSRLSYLIKIEQRRAKDKAKFQDPIQQFKAKLDVPRGASRSGNGEDGEEREQEEVREKAPAWRDEGDDEDEDEDDADEQDDDEQGTLRLGHKKEVLGYADDEADEEHELDDIEAPAGKKYEKPLFSDDEEDANELDVEKDAESSDSDEAVSTGKAIKSSAKAKAQAYEDTVDTVTKDDGLLVDAVRGTIELPITFDATARRILMVQLAEKAANECTVRVTKNINNAYAVPCDVGKVKGAGVQTEGVNMEAIFALPESLVAFNEIKCNDIFGILNIYGVEAARMSIVSEIMAVFGSYGINVNPRHLSLIADFMTRNGSYVPMNRNGMWSCPSPFLQMSFETTCTFLNQAAQDGLSDNQESPSARLVVGSVAKVGTGCFDLLVPLESN